ncbi:aldehyde oxidase 4-like protein [Corchorus capsularis]|uniref:Aldehyde oxidase 4-like protein n=1 Tax=Corchorus capsularis TaxID=210143 RepID=A0A1R3HTM3_COCAP|nr:aldehyde oxidase 4-like protein [Corchorus capsularis]
MEIVTRPYYSHSSVGCIIRVYLKAPFGSIECYWITAKSYDITILGSRITLLVLTFWGPPLLLGLAGSFHYATRAAIKEAKRQLSSWSGHQNEPDSTFQLEVAATMPVVKAHCGLDCVERPSAKS